MRFVRSRKKTEKEIDEFLKQTNELNDIYEKTCWLEKLYTLKIASMK